MTCLQGNPISPAPPSLPPPPPQTRIPEPYTLERRRPVCLKQSRPSLRLSFQARVLIWYVYVSLSLYIYISLSLSLSLSLCPLSVSTEEAPLRKFRKMLFQKAR